MALATLTWFDLLILSTATWRLANMLTREHGPWHIFEKLREKAPLGGLTTCIQCISVWCAALLLVLHFFVPVSDWLILIFAISGLALMLKSFTGAGHDV